MRRLRSLTMLALSICFLLVGSGCTRKAEPAKDAQSGVQESSELSKPYAMTTGELAALRLNQLVTTLKYVETPMLITFDAENDELEVWLIGDESTVDGAKEAIEEARGKALVPASVLLKATHGIILQDSDFSIVYYNVEKSATVLKWTNGEYKM